MKSRASNELREPHQRSQFGEAQRTHPRTYRFNQFHLFDGLFFVWGGVDNRTVFLRSKKTWFAEAAIFAKQKSTAESRMSNFFGNRISGRKNAKCRVPTLALIVLISSIFLMVCFLFGAGWIKQPFCGCFIRADFSGRYEINAEHCMRSVTGM